jgi:glycosyltransferase involved in cell wall biosynthesis
MSDNQIVPGCYSENILVKIYIITYRRPVLLKRALNSLLAQTHQHWVAEVINDDPLDVRVAELIRQFADPRISLSEPAVKRGGTGSFNYAFRGSGHLFSGMLEDDNWYEPGFIELMLKALIENAHINVAVANENIWREEADGSWTDTSRTIWQETSGRKFYFFKTQDKCGAAKICNSSMLWRTEGSNQWLTPEDLPIDVTEHFRERVVPHPILLVNEPLVNYAQTIHTSRSNALAWSSYQTLLISSVFTCVDNKQELADRLWAQARITNRQFKTTLLHTALSHHDSLVLLKKAKIAELFRYTLTWIKNPVACFRIVRSHKYYRAHWDFLLTHWADQIHHI